MNAGPLYSYEASIDIEAPPERVWALVMAMERYGEWSSENQGGYWRKGPDGVPGTGAVGDQFVGINRDGDQEWKGLVEIVERQEHRAYAFVTGGAQANYVFWRYRLDPVGTGTRLTEQWELRTLSPPMIDNGEAFTQRRVDRARESIGATLAGLKRVAETADAG